MKTVDKMQILHSQSAEFIEQGETGKFLKLIPDTFIIKGGEREGGVHQGYAIRHLNRKDIILIDVVESATKEAVKKLITDGYSIKGILISNSDVYKTAYDSLKTISEDAGGAPVFMHPRITVNNGDKVKDITSKNEVMKHFGLTVTDLPGNGGGSVLIYSDINDGMLFTGADAEGSPYDSNENTFMRPKLEHKNDEFGLAEAWNAYDKPFAYLFPLKGKPGFNLEDGQQTDILQQLGKIQS
ncbi:hypothetical protein FK178_04065 [Antarcticibacterium arcticum]|uniref:Uncharacterized protein n=1 Tax=Antarcticibacterium arcticum TaxID=2585771 RepID=A0A5B8YIQ9_9FLAO|nr:hypothetical protein [Antarcticibacterium arcticum]QED36938.1 hypothetical protein FK178_04065 [Antarcticibacterium arcticum]